MKQIVPIDVGTRVANGFHQVQRIIFGFRCAKAIGADVRAEGICAWGSEWVESEAISFERINPLARAGAASVSPCYHKEGEYESGQNE
ncbi:MAG TPA: hypothetical protein VMH27_09415 [Puia sp.]|nr:hypothetical protein [Puia sp.]